MWAYHVADVCSSPVDGVQENECREHTEPSTSEGSAAQFELPATLPPTFNTGRWSDGSLSL